MIDYDSVQSCELGQFHKIPNKTHKDIELMEILLSSNFNTLDRMFKVTVRDIIGLDIVRGRCCSVHAVDLCQFHSEIIC